LIDFIEIYKNIVKIEVSFIIIKESLVSLRVQTLIERKQGKLNKQAKIMISVIWVSLACSLKLGSNINGGFESLLNTRSKYEIGISGIK